MLSLVAALFTALLAHSAQRSPSADRVEIVPGEVIDLTYEPARDQAKLQKPASWCARLRTADPLLSDARRAASSRQGLSSLGLAGASNSPASAASTRVVTNERTCETAALRYDALKFGGGSTTIEEHPAIHAVIVVAIGDAYLVEDATARGAIWIVVGFDRDWNELGSYGEGG